MDGIRLTEHFLKKIRTRQAEISETLMSGGISSLEQYQNLMGQVSALGEIEQTLKETRSRLERDEDD